ncbi:MAG TPA: PIN domain-containing protein [Lacunisphaera sp.]|nr:PIN domain-containing protein [Lacunisphaera sp.]
MPATVLDSHALVAFLREEAGSEIVRKILEKAAERDAPVLMTEVNYAEAQYIIRRKEGDAAWAAIARDLPVMPIEFHPADRRLADMAAEYKSQYKLSLADAFAAALAKAKKAELVTGDPEFKALEKDIKITWLR